MIDAVIKKIRASKDRNTARTALMAKPFEFSEIQANHILDLTLGRLTQLGRDELAAEQKSLNTSIKELRKILASRDTLMGVIRDELTAIRDAHATKRRTRIVADNSGDISAEELVDDEPLVVSVTARGYVQARSARGRGAKVANAGENDVVAVAYPTFALASMLFFTNSGRVYRAACHDLPKQRLTAAPNLFQTGEGEQVVAALSTDLIDQHEHVVLVTARGQVKRTSFGELGDISNRKDGAAAMKLDAGDRVVAAYPGWDDFECLVVTRDGQGIRFAESEVRAVSRSAGGMRAIKLKGDDEVVGACAVAHEEIVVLCTRAGFAKRVRVDELPIQARGGSGVRVAKAERGRGPLAALGTLAPRMAFVTADACVVAADTDVKLQPRDGAGTRVSGIAEGAEVVRVSPVADPLDET
jgi:DNA gyrase subunit A